MKLERKIEKWMEDEQFTKYVEMRINTEIMRKENHERDPTYNLVLELFEERDEYVHPLVDYLTFCLHMSILCANPAKRSRGIWWVLIQTMKEGRYIETFIEKFSPLLEELRRTIIPQLRKEYVQKLKRYQTNNTNHGNKES